MVGMSGSDTDGRDLYRRACSVMPGGVNSPVRAFRKVGGVPVIFDSGRGAYLRDRQGKRFLDLVMGWGSLILGHSHPEIAEALAKALQRGTHFGALTLEEVEFAERLREGIPNLELVRLTNSGTEATMSAVRLARAYTGRDKIVKFEGGYHGHADALLATAGGSAFTGKAPCRGIPSSCVADVLVLPYNDPQALQDAFSAHGTEIAAAIVEPVAGNMGVVPSRPEFLQSLRTLTGRYGSVLIFDEVITGFRRPDKSCQVTYGVEADLVCLGKVIGGGLPIGAFGGKREIMEMVAPSGEVYQAGTFSGNLLSVTAGLATLQVLEKGHVYPHLEDMAERLAAGLEALADQHAFPLEVNRFGPMLSIFFASQEIVDHASALKADAGMYSKYFHKMLDLGVYIPPSPWEAWFLSSSHAEEDIKLVLEASERAFLELKREKQDETR